MDKPKLKPVRLRTIIMVKAESPWPKKKEQLEEIAKIIKHAPKDEAWYFLVSWCILRYIVLCKHYFLS